MTSRGISRPKLRTQVLVGVLTITLLVLAAFDLAAVNALRRYLVGQTDSRLQTVLTVTQPQLNLLIPAAAAGAAQYQYRVAGVRASTGTLVASASLADVDAAVGRFRVIVAVG